ncbi:MAG: GNAT family N-acetyltransferase [Eggerthellaceae bacterium]|nr:GNAT family N-acetyltransferase [Eggerthellaceae bacterium]
MAVTFKPVETPEDQHVLADLASQIWFEYWPEHIGYAQTEYMVQNFQSIEAITRDMAENGYEYWFICATDDDGEERIVGYTGGHPEPETNRYFISKIYLRACERGKHFASRVFEFYDTLCKDRGFSAMYLTVNKYNELAIRAYVGKGFKTIDSVETDIGCGFIMDDFVMQKSVEA